MPANLSFDVSVYSPNSRYPNHRHDELQLSIVLEGRVLERVGSGTETGSPLSVVAKDSGVVHANDFGGKPPKLARLTLPLGALTDLVDDPSRAPGWIWTHDPRVARPFIRLVTRAARENIGTFAADDPDLLDLLAAFTARSAKPATGSPPRWLDDLMAEIRSSWDPNLDVAAVARRAGVHPVYLARCIRRWFGTGLGEELRRARTRFAAARLIECTGTVSRIACDSGFADEAHLCRSFRNDLGLTPRSYRRLVQVLQQT